MAMNPHERMVHLDKLFSHVWMVRTFLKHSDEAKEDEELQEVHRLLYDVMLALGAPLSAKDPEAYFRQAQKKLNKLRKATTLFLELQPEISSHTNFQMAAQSLAFAVSEIEKHLPQIRPG